MKNTFRKIELAMNDQMPLPALPAAGLRLLSLAYESVVRLRLLGFRQQLLRSRSLPCMVISVGNLTVGGTGKTPMTQYVALLCHRLGYKTVVISRGYKGTAERQGGIVSDGRGPRMTALEAGDEPFLLAGRLRDIPVLVGRNRFAAGMTAVNEFQPEVIVLDDAFQHLAVRRDIDLVLLDRKRPLGNGRPLPRGTLREPAASLARADAVIFTRADQAEIPLEPALKKHINGKPVFYAVHQPYVAAIVPAGVRPAPIGLVLPRMTALENRSVFLFSGIARNQDFRKAIKEQGAEIKGCLDFGDHHQYTMEDIRQIRNAAVALTAEFIVTTEKDFSRLGDRFPLPIDLWVIGIRIVFTDAADSFEAFIRRKLSAGGDSRKAGRP